MEKIEIRIYHALFIFFIIASLTGCGSRGGDSDGNGGGSSAGELSISVTDAPVDNASSVVIEFTGVTLQPENGNRLDFEVWECSDTGTPCDSDADCTGGTDVCNSPRHIDLLALNSGASETILDGVTVPAGHYSWIRLNINAAYNTMDSYIDISGDATYSLCSKSKNGLQLVSGFNVPSGGSASFTIDFDLRRSVNLPQGQGSGSCPGDYRLKPTLRMVDNSNVGSIAGTVSSGLVQDASCTRGNAVYVFEDGNITPDDVDGTDDPVTTAMVHFNVSSQKYIYKAAFLSPGTYTAAFTCQAENDDPETDESLTASPIVFVGTDNVVVSSGSETIHDFQ